MQEPWRHAESMLSDVRIGENAPPPPLHNNRVATLYDSCNQRDVQTEQ